MPAFEPTPVACPAKDCGKPVFHGITPRLKKLVIDAKPVGWPDGNVKVLGPSLDGSEVVRIEVITRAQLSKLFGIRNIYRQHTGCSSTTKPHQRSRSS